MASDHESHGEGNHADQAAPVADVAEASAATSGEAPGNTSEAPVKKAARRRATRPAKSTAPSSSSSSSTSSTPSASGSSPAADSAPADVASALAQIELPPAPGDAPAEAATGGQNGAEAAPAKRRPARKRTTPRPAPRAEATDVIEGTDPAATDPTSADPTAAQSAAAQSSAQPTVQLSGEAGSDAPAESVKAEPVKAARRSRRKAVAPAQAPASSTPALPEAAAADPVAASAAEPTRVERDDAQPAVAAVPVLQPLFQAPEPVRRPRRSASRPAGPPTPVAGEVDDALAAVVPAVVPTQELVDEDVEDTDLIASLDADDVVPDLIDEEISDEDSDDEASEEAADGGDQPRRRRRRGGRGRRGRTRAEGDESEAGDAAGAEAAEPVDAAEIAEDEEPAGDDEAEESEDAAEGGGSSRRRRRRRRRGASAGDAETAEDPPNTVTRVRESRSREPRESRDSREDTATGIKGSTRLEAKKQRRREGREQGRRRQVISEAEFLARRESVERVMVVRENDGRTQIGVLEDGVLVEHYVARKTQSSMVGNVYLGRVQNVLPSMEAAFIDIGKGRNAVLYAGEVNWDQAGLDGQPRRIENALKAGEPVLVQVTKDPIGHKGARLTSQISMPGRYLVYVPEGSMTGISRKLPENERARLKKVLKAVVPEHAGVIVRTAAEGASDLELERDVARLQAQWDDIDKKVAGGNAPTMLYSEPDLAIRVVRDIFNEDFSSLVISGDDAWDTIQGYIGHVAPDLAERVTRWDGQGDVFSAKRIDEQLHKAMERKVWLPSGGSLVIDRTEAMTVVDVNTGKFTGSGGSNLEETVTKNNVEAAEEVVRQLRLRDIGGIIVVDFIDMVLESNRDLVMRRLLECLGRDRTRHQVAEVTSLGLVQMTRKRVGQGLVEVFSENCEHCGGRGIIVHDEPVEKKQDNFSGSGGGNGRRGRN